MTTTTVSDAVILPQSQGTGLSGENATIDAAINGVLNRYVGGEYVASEYSTGLAFQNHDATNDTVEVGPGIVFVQDNSTSTGGQRSSSGNPQAESSTTSGYDTELPEGHTYAVLLPTATEISVSDSTLNEVYVDIGDVTANNSVNLEHDGSTTASPGSTSLKIGETNPDDASADTRANDDASPTFDSLTVNGTTDTDALNAKTVEYTNVVPDYLLSEYHQAQEETNQTTTSSSYAAILNLNGIVPFDDIPDDYALYGRLRCKIKSDNSNETVFVAPRVFNSDTNSGVILDSLEVQTSDDSALVRQDSGWQNIESNITNRDDLLEDLTLQGKTTGGAQLEIRNDTFSLQFAGVKE